MKPIVPALLVVSLLFSGCAKESVKVSHVSGQADAVIARMDPETQARYLHQRLVDSRSPIEVTSIEVGFTCESASAGSMVSVCDRRFLILSSQDDDENRASVVRVNSNGAKLVRRYSQAELAERFLREISTDSGVASEPVTESGDFEAMKRLMNRLITSEPHVLRAQTDALATQGLTRFSQCRILFLGTGAAPAQGEPTVSADFSASSESALPLTEAVPSPSHSPSSAFERRRLQYLALCQFGTDLAQDSNSARSSARSSEGSVGTVLEVSTGQVHLKRVLEASELSAFLGL